MKPPHLILRNGVIGGLLLVLSRALDTVLFYLNGYVLIMLLIGVLAFTARATRKSHPQTRMGTAVVISWGVYVLAMAIAGVHQRIFYATNGDPEPLSYLLLFAFGGVLSLLVVSVCRLVMPTYK
jgi:RsiW-degrading membrane proteinase PrsW (M82 family)